MKTAPKYAILESKIFLGKKHIFPFESQTPPLGRGGPTSNPSAHRFSHSSSLAVPSISFMLNTALAPLSPRDHVSVAHYTGG